MQVDNWLPRVALPSAAPSRPELLLPLVSAEPLIEALATDSAPAEVPAVAPAPVVKGMVRKVEMPRPRVVVPEPIQPAPLAPPVRSADKTPLAPPPRFALQLLRAGNCLLLVELPTGESFQRRDPAYLLLKDLLRAARLPDNPQQVGDGEPIRWPLLHRGSLDQSGEAARDYVQGVVSAELENMGCACLWLVGLPALRFAGEVDAEAFFNELNIEGIGRALAVPGLEHLMEEPASKAALWKAMRRSMPHWVLSS